MTKDEAIAILVSDNPRAAMGQIRIYVDAWAEYTAAAANIDEHGTVVQHPRTGAPIPNPYLPVRDRASATISKSRLQTDRLWRTTGA